VFFCFEKERALFAERESLKFESVGSEVRSV